MTNDTPNPKHGETYLTIYSGGPFDGRTEERIATEDGIDGRIASYAAVDGQETEIVYTAVKSEKVGDVVHVSYVLDASDGDPIEDPEDRGGRQ